MSTARESGIPGLNGLPLVQRCVLWFRECGRELLALLFSDVDTTCHGKHHVELSLDMMVIPQ